MISRPLHLNGTGKEIVKIGRKNFSVVIFCSRGQHGVIISLHRWTQKKKTIRMELKCSVITEKNVANKGKR